MAAALIHMVGILLLGVVVYFLGMRAVEKERRQRIEAAKHSAPAHH